MCTVSGYQGMPSLKIRPKSLSRHGRQYVYEAGSKRVLFNIGKVCRGLSRGHPHSQQLSIGGLPATTHTTV